MQLTAQPALPDVTTLLSACGLPTDDVTADLLPDFVMARDGAPVGVAGLQVFGATALLRSVAVAPERRTSGVGARLVAAAEARARQRGVQRLYLLTTDAQGFFAKLGYERLERCAAPAEVQACAQFGSSSCSGATLMSKPLEG